MNYDYTIRNFRAFDTDGATCRIRPVTILTGCNSSGKSSIVKSMTLFQDFIKNAIKHDNILAKSKLDFSLKPNSSLGNFNKVLNDNSLSNTLSYTIKFHSLLFGDDLLLSFDFASNENDAMGNGYIKSFNIKKTTGELIYSSTVDCSCYYNLNHIIPNFYRFINGQYIIYLYRYQLELALDEQGEKIEHYDSFISLYNKINKLNKEFEDFYGKNAICDIRKWCDSHMSTSRVIKKEFLKDGGYFPFYMKPESLITPSSEYAIFYMPILSQIKDDTVEDIDEFFKKYDDKEYTDMFERVRNSFRKSGYSKFIDYFHDLEKKALIYENRTFPKPSPTYFDIQKYEIKSDCKTECKRFMLSSGGYHCTIDGVNYNFKPLPLNYKKTWMEAPITFADLLSVITYIDSNGDDLDKILESQKYYDYDKRQGGFAYKYQGHRMFYLLRQYADDLLKECISGLNNDLNYVSSSVVDIKRLYSLDSTDPFSVLIKEYLDKRRDYLDRKSEEANGLEFCPGSFIDKWLKAFGIGHHLSIEVNEDGYGLSIKVYNSQDDHEGELLSEKGYGITQLFVILLRIEMSILGKEVHSVVKDSHALYDTSLKVKHIPNCEFLVPLEKEEIAKVFSPTTVAIEEPEVHLHPKYQSLLADMFVDAYINYNVQFIIETHSEYLIRKLQTLVAAKKIKSEDCSLEYFSEANKPKEEPRVKHIHILDDGKLSGAFGPGFFDEANRLSMDLLSI